MAVSSRGADGWNIDLIVVIRSALQSTPNDTWRIRHNLTSIFKSDSSGSTPSPPETLYGYSAFRAPTSRGQSTSMSDLMSSPAHGGERPSLREIVRGRHHLQGLRTYLPSRARPNSEGMGIPLDLSRGEASLEPPMDTNEGNTRL